MCNENCGGGNQSRSRDIKTPAACGGKECEGDTEEHQSCNNQTCTGTPLTPNYGIMQNLLFVI